MQSLTFLGHLSTSDFIFKITYLKMQAANLILATSVLDVFQSIKSMDSSGDGEAAFLPSRILSHIINI